MQDTEKQKQTILRILSHLSAGNARMTDAQQSYFYQLYLLVFTKKELLFDLDIYNKFKSILKIKGKKIR